MPLDIAGEYPPPEETPHIVDARVVVSTLANARRGEPGDGRMGSIAIGSLEIPGEAFLTMLVSEPESMVARLAGYDAADLRAHVDELANAPTEEERKARKERLPAWVPAEFRGARRNNDECVGRQVIGHDFDRVDAATFEEACDAIRLQLPDRFLAIHTSPSERKHGAWCLRAYEVLDRAASPSEWEARVKPHLRSLGEHDPRALDIARFFFLPLKTAGYRFKVYEGPRTRLDDLRLAPTAPKQKSATVTAKAAPAAADRRTAAAQLLASAWPGDGHRHGAQLALSGALCRDAWPKDDALTFVCDVCRIAGNEDRPKREKTIADTYKRAETGGSFYGWAELERVMDPVVVNAARDLLRRDAAESAALRSLAVPKTTTREPTQLGTTHTTSGLGFQYGGWDSEPPPIDFLADGLIPRGAVAMFFGRANSMKTWLAYSLGIALASGQPWLGHTTKTAKVGIVDYETGKANLRRRLYMLQAGDNPNLAAVTFTALKPNDKQFWTELAREAFDVVFVDSLRRSNPGANENDSAEAILPLELAAEFSEATGCAVVWIHHAKKASGDGWPEFRGSAAIEDQVDCAFAVRQNDLTTSRKLVDVRCDKPGDMKTPDPFTAEIVFDDAKKTVSVGIASPVAEPAQGRETAEDIAAQIRFALMGGPLATKEKIKEHVTGERKRVYTEIDALKATGEIARIVDVGYVLDSPAERRRRVLEQVRSSGRWTSAAKLAKASHVPTPFVEKLMRDGVIVPSVSGGGDLGGFIVVRREGNEDDEHGDE